MFDPAHPIFWKFSADIGDIVAVLAQCESVQDRTMTAEKQAFSMRM